MNALPLLVLATLAAAPETARPLATVTTEYDVRDHGRSWNIALAAARIDGTLLRPGQPFSFNRTVGPRGLEDGFRPAPELIDGDRVEGIGGGVCQVASTLYAAALEAGLTIDARQAHSRPSRYLPPGLDATVSHSRGVDLVLRNDSAASILLRVRADAGRVSASVEEVGRAGSQLERRTIVEISNEAAGEGVEVTVLRTLDLDGAGELRELVSRDLYRGGPSIDATDSRDGVQPP